MGKHSRRKRQHSKNKSSKKQQEQENNDNHNNPSTLLAKIRHSDARTRHAALTALSATLLDPQSLQKQQTKHRAIQTELLQAVRERIMDTDLECAQAAAGCVANFCNFNQQRNKDEITAGWTVVLVGRLHQCRDALLAMSDDTKTTSKSSSSSSPKQWWAVTSQCLHALCALVESNPDALDRLTPGSSLSAGVTTSTQEHCIGTLLDLLSVGTSQLQNLQQAQQKQQKKEQQEDHKELVRYIEDATIYSVRTLHSALDDNYDLLQPWLQKNEAVSMEGLKLLASCCSNSNNRIPPAAKLHAAGCLVTARQLLVLHHSSDTTSTANPFLTLVQSQVMDYVIPVLTQQFMEYSNTFFSTSARTEENGKSCQELLTTLCHAQQQFQQEMADDAMEREIIQKVSRRKEPARMIARRQKLDKERKEKEQQQKASSNEENVAMMQEDANDNNDTDNTKNKIPEERQNIRETMEQARQAWHNTLLPLQLGLEISANLTSIVPMDNFEGGDDDDDDAMMMDEDEWGPDQEAQLLASSNAEQQQQDPLSTYDTVLIEKIVAQQLPDSMVKLLHHACTPIVIAINSNNNDDDKMMNEEDTTAAAVIPPDVQQDLMDIQSKCGSCIGNCLGNLSTWKSSDAISVWKELRHASENLIETINNNNNDTHTNSYDGMEGIVNAMVVALQTRPTLRSQMQEGDLDFLLSFLMLNNSTSKGSNHDKKNNIKPTLQRDAACALGILCSTEVHPAQINTKVCTALTTCCLNSKSAMVLSEILNSLMDMYGDDDTHPQVFEALNVLVCFQKTVPMLKKQILLERSDASPEDVDQWKEIVLNASRFIQYKKGQL